MFVLYFYFNFEYVKWRARHRHISQERMGSLAKRRLLDRLTKIKLPRVKPSGKVIAKPVGKALRVSGPIELIHSDIWTHKS